jgi:uncharacterized membrane protein
VEPHARYRIEQGKLCVDIRLRTVQQLFDHRDPAPFRERDLDVDAVEYLTAAVEDIPRSTPFKLVIWLAEPLAPPLTEEVLVSSVCAHFAYERDRVQRRIRLVLHRGQQIFWLGLALLVLCLLSAELLVKHSASTFLRLLREGIVITGWVALWRPLDAMLYDWWPLLHERRTLSRLVGPEIEVRFDKGPS